jgi:hypothetical protein
MSGDAGHVSVQQVMALLARANELAKEESLALLHQSGNQMPALVASNRLLLGVDRSYARDMLTRIDGQKLLAATRVDIRSSIRVTQAAAVLLFPCLLALVGLSFWAFGWWGFLAIPAAFFMFQFGANSNMKGGWFSIWLAMAFGAIAIQAPNDPVFYWSVSGAFFAISQRLIYTVPTKTVRRAALESLEFAELAIGAYAVVLKRPELSGAATQV